MHQCQDKHIIILTGRIKQMEQEHIVILLKSYLISAGNLNLKSHPGCLNCFFFIIYHVEGAVNCHSKFLSTIFGVMK